MKILNKAFYIVSLCLSFIFLLVVGYYIECVEDARSLAYYSSYSSYGYSGYSADYSSEYTQEAGLVSIFFFLFFIATDLLGFIKLKRKTTKVLSIISLSIGGLFLVWDILMISSPGNLSFDEVGPAFVLFSLLIMAFSIVGIVQSTRFARGEKQVRTAFDSDILDS